MLDAQTRSAPNFEWGPAPACKIVKWPGFEGVRLVGPPQWGAHGLNGTRLTTTWEVFYYDGRYIPDTHNGREEPFSAILTPSKTITVHDFVPISGKWVQSENFYLSYFDPCNGTFHFKFKQICGSDYFKPPVRRRPPEDDEVADGSSGGSSGGFGHPPDDSEENQRRQCFEPFIPGICRPFPEDRRLAPSEQELAGDEVILVAENISHDRRKYGFSTYIPQPEGQIPDYYLTQVIKQHLDGGSPESHVGGIVREKVCVQDGSIIQVDRIGNPSYHGLPDIHDPNATQTSWSAQWNVKSYDDCPNQEPDTPGKMTASATLSEPHTTGKFKLDTFQNAWAHKDFFEKTAPHANLVLSKTEDSIQYTKTRYQVRIGADVALPFKTHVIEEFTPEHDPASTPAEKEYRMRNITITTGNKSATYSIDPQSEPDKEGIWRVFLLPVEVISDLNNDGEITSADNALRDAALKSGASDENKKKGTEFLFINDKMSNGVWDVDDDGVMTYSYGSGYEKMPKPPASHKDDDDAEPLKVSVGGLNTGVVWFDHPAIDKLEFFETRECLPGDKLNLTSASPFDLSADTLPEMIYVRLRDDWAGTDQDGNLRMFIGKSIAEVWGELQLPLTVVRDFGSEHFFHAARDYILENNARVCIRDHGYPFGPDPSVIFRLCVMREEATTMTAFDALAGGHKGISASYPATPGSAAVMINGNQCFFAAGWNEGTDFLQTMGKIADKCHGRVIRGGVTSTISSDNFDVTTKPAEGSPLAGPDPIPAGTLVGPDGVSGTPDDIANPYAGDPGGKYLGRNSGSWTFAAGRAGGSDALGGLSTNYASAKRADKAHQMIGYAEGEETGKGCIFTATQIKGVGYGPIVKGDARVAGVPALSPSVDAGAIKLFILDSGAGSLALMHIDPTGTMRGAYMGRKTNFGFPYYVNNYLALDPARPRP